jgi:hypothetical protein
MLQGLLKLSYPDRPTGIMGGILGGTRGAGDEGKALVYSSASKANSSDIDDVGQRYA